MRRRNRIGMLIVLLAGAFAFAQGASRPAPTPGIEGLVVDELGKPVAGAAVRLVLPFDLAAARAGRTQDHPATAADGQGRFRFAALPPDAQVGFEITAPGFARVLAGGSFLPGQKGLRFVLPPEGRLEGTVVEKDGGKPIAGVSLHAMGSVTSGIHHGSARTGKDGRFVMGGLTGGTYNLEIVGTEQAPAQWVGSVEKAAVENGKTASAKIEALRGGTLEFALTEAATGKPAAGHAMVTVCPAADQRIRSESVPGKDGVVRFCLAPGRYVVQSISSTAYRCGPQKDKVLDVEAGKVRREVLKLAPIPPLTIAVRDPSGRPVPKALVRVLGIIGPPMDLTADADGRVTLAAEDIGPMLCLVYVRHPREKLSALVAASVEATPPAVTLVPAAEVSGTVVDERGGPLAGAAVQVHVEAPHIARFGPLAHAVTDARGRYRLDSPGEGRCIVSARSPGRAAAEIAVKGDDPARAGKPLPPLVLRRADRTVRGVVVDGRDKPVAGAVVAAGPKVGMTMPGAGVTDERGRFAIDGLCDEPETRLWVHVPGRGWIGDVEIKAGDTDVTVTVAPSHWD